MSKSAGNRLYRSRSGIVFGVCKGIADWSGMSVALVRIIWVVLMASTGFFPFGVLYLLMAYFLPEKPLYEDDRQEERMRYAGFCSYTVREQYDSFRDRYRNTGDFREKDWDRRFSHSR